MKTFLILASALGIAYAGVGNLSPSEEADALNLFNSICSGAGSEGQNIGGTQVYCKRANGEINESTKQRVNVPGQSGQSQTVFVQPPPARYQHFVDIVSGGGQGGQTKIFVLPQQATHSVTPNIQQQPGSQTKPVVYFLRGGSYSSSIRGPEPNYGPPPSQPIIRESYGAPPQRIYETPVQVQQSYGAPPQRTYEAPVQVQQSYGAPPQRTYEAPVQVQQSYGAPPQRTYEAPVQVQQSYGAPQLAQSYGTPEPNLGGYGNSRVARSSNYVIPANYVVYPITVEKV